VLQHAQLAFRVLSRLLGSVPRQGLLEHLVMGRPGRKERTE